MSFFDSINHKDHALDLRNAWKSLSYDIYNQTYHYHPTTVSSHRFPLTPPLTPDNNEDIKRSQVCGCNNELSHVNLGQNVVQCNEKRKTNHKKSHKGMNYYYNPLSSPKIIVSQKETEVELHYKQQFRYRQTEFSSNYSDTNITNNPIFNGKRHEEREEASRAQGNKIQMEEVACQVHGLLSLPGCREPRYNITADELHRRVNQPECLSKVDMISYVRLAKNSARLLLDKHNVKTNQYSRRSEHSVLSKMCETETQVLARGIRDINLRYFPGKWFAMKSIEEISKLNPTISLRHKAFTKRMMEGETTRCILLDIYYGLEKRKDDNDMKDFNLISHTFGVPNLQNHIMFLLTYIEEEIELLRNMVIP